jgi:hypothetical protein
MRVGAVTDSGGVNARTSEPAIARHHRRTPAGIADASGSGVTQAAPVSANAQDRKAQLAEKYRKELYDLFKPGSCPQTKEAYLAAKNAVISALGVNPADPNDLKEFHPDHQSVVAVTTRLHSKFRLSGSDSKEKNIECLADQLDGFRAELMANDLENFIEAFRAEPARKALRESPEGQRALRNALSWVATPPLYGDHPDQALRYDIVQLYVGHDPDLSRYFESVRPR